MTQETFCKYVKLKYRFENGEQAYIFRYLNKLMVHQHDTNLEFFQELQDVVKAYIHELENPAEEEKTEQPQISNKWKLFHIPGQDQETQFEIDVKHFAESDLF